MFVFSRSFASKAAVALLLAATVEGSEPPLTPEAFAENIAPFFSKHCVACHGEKKQKADRRFDTLSYPISDTDTLLEYQDALDMLNLGEMPPEDEPQPEEEEKAAVVGWLTRAIADYHTNADSTGGETVLRRLNKREYLHTVGDLFDLKTESFNPTEIFPTDQKIHHLDNQGHALVTSGFLLEGYLKAADQVIEKALPSLTAPKEQEWSFENGFRQQPEMDHHRIRAVLAERELKRTEENMRDLPEHIRLYEHPRSERHFGSYAPLSRFREGVPHDGYYLIRVSAEAMNLGARGDTEFLKLPSDHRMRLAVVPGDQRVSDLHHPQATEPILAQFTLPRKGEREYQAKIWLEKGTTPRFIYPNGTGKSRRALIGRAEELLHNKGEKLGSGHEYFIHGLGHADVPYLKISKVTLRGPINDEWPTAMQRKLLGGPSFDSAKNEENVRSFLDRAYRRPATDEEVASIIKLIAHREAKGIEPFQAYKDGLKAALCSPSFLYLEEPTSGEREDLDSYAIASRLSYFLWSSLPDEALMVAAASDALATKKERKAQFTRMMKDAKAERFLNGFLDAWLTLNELGDQPPDRNRFEYYYRDNLKEVMREETQLFAKHILEEGLPIDLFLKSDFTFANPALANLYGIEHDFAGKDEFQKVQVGRKPRGGLMTQASVLTVTANGVDTSPIVRGVWVLENILGTPPSPPPPDVEPLDPDIRGATSIRDQFERHRADPSCAECHRKIDPIGFALENFDAVGAYRSEYRTKGKRIRIDPSGRMPGGWEFTSVNEFREAIMEEKDKFARALTEKLFSYALGRPVEATDRPEIDAILADLNENDREFRYLIQRVVLSDAFEHP